VSVQIEVAQVRMRVPVEAWWRRHFCKPPPVACKARESLLGQTDRGVGMRHVVEYTRVAHDEDREDDERRETGAHAVDFSLAAKGRDRPPDQRDAAEKARQPQPGEHVGQALLAVSPGRPEVPARSVPFRRCHFGRVPAILSRQ
jgi:hypothetical protein